MDLLIARKRTLRVRHELRQWQIWLRLAELDGARVLGVPPPPLPRPNTEDTHMDLRYWDKERVSPKVASAIEGKLSVSAVLLVGATVEPEANATKVVTVPPTPSISRSTGASSEV